MNSPAHPSHPSHPSSSRPAARPSHPPRPAPAAREIGPEKLPFSCPPPGAAGWNLHPRVFLPLSPEKPEIACPYCGAKYRLKQEPSA